jgi:hypothetical protein
VLLEVATDGLCEMEDEASPASLMRSTETLSRITVEILVEEDQVLPVRLILVDGVGTVAGSFAFVILEENTDVAHLQLVLDK